MMVTSLKRKEWAALLTCDFAVIFGHQKLFATELPLKLSSL